MLERKGNIIGSRNTISLGDMRDKGMTMLTVACSKCDRRGRLRIARLIAEHGDDPPNLKAIIAQDCPRFINPHVSIYERCGVHFPNLRDWFIP